MSIIPDSVAVAVRALYGSRHARRMRLDALRHACVAEGLAALTAAGGRSTSTEAPIFVFSAGWRSGSTLLQRLLMSGGDLLLWGEPYDRCCLVQRLAETVRPFSSGWPPAPPPGEAVPLATMPKAWIANLYPPPAALQASYRALLETLFKAPARQRGASRWGVKEVRFGADEARLLRWLYPDARLLFLYRCPYAAYRSYKAFQAARGWYIRWPDRHAFTAWAFARHWRRLAGDLVRCADEVDALLVPYEALADGSCVPAIARYCDLSLDTALLNDRVGSGREKGGGMALTPLERQLIRWATAPLAARLGYDGSADAMPPAGAPVAASASSGATL